MLAPTMSTTYRNNAVSLPGLAACTSPCAARTPTSFMTGGSACWSSALCAHCPIPVLTALFVVQSAVGTWAW